MQRGYTSKAYEGAQRESTCLRSRTGGLTKIYIYRYTLTFPKEPLAIRGRLPILAAGWHGTKLGYWGGFHHSFGPRVRLLRGVAVLLA